MAVFVADDEGDLGVGFEAFDAVKNLGPGAAEFFGSVEIVGFVEAGLEFDKGGHLLAGFGGVDEGIDNLGVFGGAVEGLLDGEDVGIARGFLDKADDGAVALVRVGEDEILFLVEDFEDAAGGVDLGGFGPRNRGSAEVIVAIRHGEREEVGEGEGGVLGEEDLVKIEVEEGDELVGEVVVLRGLKTDGEGLAPGVDDLVDFFGEVVGFVLIGGDVGIAGEAEGGVGLDLFTGEKGGAEVGDEAF